MADRATMNRLKKLFAERSEAEKEAISMLQESVEKSNPNSNFATAEERAYFEEAVKMNALRGTARHSEWVEWSRKKQEEYFQEQQQAYQEFEQQRQQRLNASRLSVLALDDLASK